MNCVAANLPARHSSSSEEITMELDGLLTFSDDVGLVVSSTDDEHEITRAGCDAAVRSAGRRLPASAGGHATIARAPPIDSRTQALTRLNRAAQSLGLDQWAAHSHQPIGNRETL
jgi:YD repeat-containing protein